MAYPINVHVDYGEGSRSRGLAVLGFIFYLKAILLIPHFIAFMFVNIIAMFAVWIGYWAILFTGRQPDGIHRFISGQIRWSTRTNAWLVSTTDKYPNFGFADGPEGAQTSIEGPGGGRSRLLALSGIIGIKFLLAIPHIVVLMVLNWLLSLIAWLGFGAIAITGKQPRGMHNLLAGGLLQWPARNWGWIGSLTDTYPPFSFK